MTTVILSVLFDEVHRLKLPKMEQVLNERKGYYFESYSELDAQENMIRDYSRTMAYKHAIEMNSHLFQGKIVLDVGCGLGILSMFAARAGAKTVIGIDASDITVYAEKVVQKNNFFNIIIKKAKVEELEELPFGIQEVDIIISEWMGICLFHESMLVSVLYARDRWLKNGGLMFPDKVRLYLAAIDDRDKVERVERWNCIEGCNMSALKDFAYNEATQATIEPHKVVTNYFKVNELNLRTATPDFSFSMNYSLTAERSGNVIGFMAYFDAIFSKCHKEIILSTSPCAPLTHWRQTIFRFRDHVWCEKGQEITGQFALKPYERNFRDMCIRIGVNTHSTYTTHRFTSEYILR